jgi:spore coat protein JB
MNPWPLYDVFGGVYFMDDQQELLEQIRAVDFVLVDLGLFLDTHPADQNALKDFKTLADTHERLTKQYESKYGPLKMMHGATDNCWLWINDPWPWDRMKGGMANVGL